jgi:hypothetical protein
MIDSDCPIAPTRYPVPGFPRGGFGQRGQYFVVCQLPERHGEQCFERMERELWQWQHEQQQQDELELEQGALCQVINSKP